MHWSLPLHSFNRNLWSCLPFLPHSGAPCCAVGGVCFPPLGVPSSASNQQRKRWQVACGVSCVVLDGIGSRRAGGGMTDAPSQVVVQTSASLSLRARPPATNPRTRSLAASGTPFPSSPLLRPLAPARRQWARARSPIARWEGGSGEISPRACHGLRTACLARVRARLTPRLRQENQGRNGRVSSDVLERAACSVIVRTSA